MKKSFVIIAVATVAMAGSALAADAAGMRTGGYGLAGCGLGSMVFEKNTKVHQVFASTTNATFGTQTFGISSGTSNCTSHGLAKVDKEQEMFVSMNLNTLHRDMARGKGETLTTFAKMLGCDSTGAAQFGKTTQTKYQAVYSKANSPEAVMAAAKTDAAQSCKPRG